MLEAAASKLSKSVGVFRLLLFRRGQQAPVSDSVVAMAAANLSEGPDLVQILLAHNETPVRITENVMIAAAKNTKTGDRVTKMLLEFDGDNITTTGGIVRAAAQNQPYGCDITSLLLRGRKDRLTLDAVSTICELCNAETVALLLAELESNWLCPTNHPDGIQVPITETVVLAASRHQLGGWTVMKSLLGQHGVPITDRAVEDIFRVYDDKIALLILARPWKSLEVTDSMVRAAVENCDSGPNIVTLLLQRQFHGISITSDIVMAAVRNEKTGGEIMTILLSQRRRWVSTEVAKAILTYFDERVAASLLRQGTDAIAITEDLAQAAATNRSFGHEVMRVLLCHYDQKIQITPEVITLAGHNVGRGTGPKILRVLREYNKIPLTDQLLPIICKYFDVQTVKVLLDSFGDRIRITSSLARAAVHNRYHRESILQLLLEDKESDISSDALPAIYKHCTVKTMRNLLDRRSLHSSEPERLFAAAACNKYEAAGVVQLLLDQSTEKMRITRKMVKAAVMNHSHGVEVLRMALQRCRRPLSARVLADIFAFSTAEKIHQLIDKEIIGTERISPDMIKALARNRTHGRQALRVLLESTRTQFDPGAIVIICRDHEEVILELLISRAEILTGPTRQLLEAAVSNWNIGANLIARLLDKFWTDDQFPESVLEAAAGNWRHGAKALAILLNRQLRMPHFTRNLIETACDNEQCGHEILRFLMKVDLLQVRQLASEDALFVAATCGQERVLDVFSKELGFDVGGNLYALAKLYKAALQGDAKVVQDLITDGVYPDTPNKRNVTPLWMAAMRGHLEVVRCLVATGRVSVNRRSVAGRSPIFFASAYGHKEIVDLLMEHNADPSCLDIRGDSPTSVAGRYELP
jgi:hypothetical protein